MIFVAAKDMNSHCLSALYPELATLDLKDRKLQYLTIGGMTIAY